MSEQVQYLKSLTLFCKVVDNYGDIGICWRLARQLEREHHIDVHLWVDDLRSFQRICPDVKLNIETQNVAGVIVHHWRDQNGTFTPEDVSDIVIEFFGCDIPPAYIQAMAQRQPRAVWLNLEGLSAEAWVEGCHTLSSPHGSLPVTKYFFFPGFNSKTGGLLIESELEQQRQQFVSDPATIAEFLSGLGLSRNEIDALKISLFCYPHAPATALFEAWKKNATPITCLVPEGVAMEAVQAFTGQPAKAGSVTTIGALTIRVLPFVPQPDYDKLLWACDLNFVRGEDSFVRAQWAAKPFVWHIYPQDENLHHVKLNAFLKCYTPNTEHLAAMMLAWNAVTSLPIQWDSIWQAFAADMPQIADLALQWQQQLIANGDMTSNLLKFAHTVHQQSVNNEQK